MVWQNFFITFFNLPLVFSVFTLIYIILIAIANKKKKCSDIQVFKSCTICILLIFASSIGKIIFAVISGKAIILYDIIPIILSVISIVRMYLSKEPEM